LGIINVPDVAAAAISGVVAPVFLLSLVSSYPVFLGLAILFGFLTGKKTALEFLNNLWGLGTE
jgi:hypothetical protein